GAPNYEDDKWYITSEFMYHTIDRHELLFGIDLSYLEQGETYVLRNYDPITLAPNGNPPVLEKFTGDDNWLKEGLERRVIGIYVQDQFTFTDKLKLTAGLRFDDYDDVGSDITPRFAAVYQLSDQKTFKLQYAQSFRPPTFPEMYSQNNPVLIGNEMLQSEHLETLEFGYVHNDGVTVFRLNLFRYNLTDLIQVDGGTGQYENQGEINANGLELEYLRQIERRVKLDANLSYMISEDAETHNRIPGVASVLGNFAILYEPWPNYVFSWQFRHVSYRQREPQDPRLDLNDYSVSDITANIFNLGVKGLSLRLGARNLLDADVLYPAPLVGDPPLPAYLNDYPQTGREIFFQVKYTHH
ncbi:MAG TPA: TonB-dependent receptor, partial [Gammaproteobacteria bacterium]